MLNICTVVARRDLAHARVLADSFRASHPDGRCHVLILDPPSGGPDLHAAGEPFALVDPDAIGCEAIDLLRTAYDADELAMALRPWLLEHLLRCHADGGVAFVEARSLILRRMTELEAMLRDRAVVLTPRVQGVLPRHDGAGRPGGGRSGVFDLGLVGLSDRPDAHRFLDLWRERMLDFGASDATSGAWADVAPGLVYDVQIMRDPAYGIARWNLHERRLTWSDEVYRSGTRPVCCVNLDGVGPGGPGQPAADPDTDEVFARLVADHRRRLRAAGHDAWEGRAYGYDLLPSGQTLDRTMRALYRAHAQDAARAASAFTPAGEAALIDSVTRPSTEAGALNRYLHAVWVARPDLQRAYPSLEGPDLDGFLGWCSAHGRHEIGIPAFALDGTERARASPGRAGESQKPVPGRRSSERARPFGVNVAGYLRSELGIGEVARQTIGALDAAEVPVLPVGLHAADSRQGHPYEVVGPADNAFAINLVCVNADGLPALVDDVGSGFLADRYSIGLWWWETSSFPDRDIPSFSLLDEIWVGSAFVAEAVGAVSPIPVVYVPVAIEVPDADPFAAGERGWPDAFTYLFSFDYSSVLERKNPLGLIQAYRQAFDPADGAALVLKSINEGFDPEGRRRVRAAAAGRPDIHLMEGYLDPGDNNRLVTSCDCYVSLHRSEGFGLTIAEAMYKAKPVIATGYSGNMTFMNGENSFPVEYTPTRIGDNAHPYPAGGEWAEPDLGHATRLMREVFEDRARAAARGARAASDIRRHHAPRTVGEVARARLERVMERLPSHGKESGGRLPELHELIASGPRRMDAARPGWARAAARSLALRVVRPYSAHQEQINAAIARELLAGDVRVANAVSRVAETEDRLARAAAAGMAEARRLRALTQGVVPTASRPSANETQP